MSFERHMKEDARLTVLLLLASIDDRTLNEHLIIRGLREMGHFFSQDQMRTELAWLKEQRLIRYEVNGATWVATILRRGEDVASGAATVPGVQRPSANEE